MLRSTLQFKGFLFFLPIFLLFSAGCQAISNYEYKGAVLDPPLMIEDFVLTDTKGQPFHLSDTEGEITLVYFGYTFCPDVCPLTMWDVKESLADVPNNHQVNVVFISVDPERDTPEVLDRYVSAFGPQFIGLTDDWAKIESVMPSFGAYAEIEETSDSAANYLVNHTARLYLINSNRELQLMYPFGFAPEDLTNDLNHLLEQKAS